MKQKLCKTCAFCKPLFRNYRDFLFERENKHYCLSCEKLVKYSDFCEKWQKKKAEYDLSPQRFQEACADVEKIAELCAEYIPRESDSFSP